MSNSLFKKSNYLDAGTDLQRGLFGLSGLSLRLSEAKKCPGVSVLEVGEAMFVFICCGFTR